MSLDKLRAVTKLAMTLTLALGLLVILILGIIYHRPLKDFISRIKEINSPAISIVLDRADKDNP